MIYPYKAPFKSDKFDTYLTNIINNFNRKKFEETCLKNRLKRKKKKK